jgi:hypothetical protein
LDWASGGLYHPMMSGCVTVSGSLSAQAILAWAHSLGVRCEFNADNIADAQ